MLPLALAAGIVPIISMLHMYDSDLERMPWFYGGEYMIDPFLYYKALAIQLIGISILILLCFLIPKNGISFLKE